MDQTVTDRRVSPELRTSVRETIETAFNSKVVRGERIATGLSAATEAMLEVVASVDANANARGRREAANELGAMLRSLVQPCRREGCRCTSKRLYDWLDQNEGVIAP